MDKVWYTSKTVLAAVVVVLLGLADQFQQIDLKSILLMLGVPDERTGGIVSMIGLGFLILRLITTSGLTLSSPDQTKDAISGADVAKGE